MAMPHNMGENHIKRYCLSSCLCSSPCLALPLTLLAGFSPSSYPQCIQNWFHVRFNKCPFITQFFSPLFAVCLPRSPRLPFIRSFSARTRPPPLTFASRFSRQANGHTPWPRPMQWKYTILHFFPFAGFYWIFIHDYCHLQWQMRILLLFS